MKKLARWSRNSNSRWFSRNQHMHERKEIPRASRLMIQLSPMAEEVQARMAKEEER
jgi:hypothetical protein